jgi:hypothetical protein
VLWLVLMVLLTLRELGAVSRSDTSFARATSTRGQTENSSLTLLTRSSESRL